VPYIRPKVVGVAVGRLAHSIPLVAELLAVSTWLVVPVPRATVSIPLEVNSCPALLRRLVVSLANPPTACHSHAPPHECTLRSLCSQAYTHFFWAGHHGPLNENKLMVFSWTILGHMTWAFIAPGLRPRKGLRIGGK